MSPLQLHRHIEQPAWDAGPNIRPASRRPPLQQAMTSKNHAWRRSERDCADKFQLESESGNSAEEGKWGSCAAQFPAYSLESLRPAPARSAVVPSHHGREPDFPLEKVRLAIFRHPLKCRDCCLLPGCIPALKFESCAKCCLALTVAYGNKLNTGNCSKPLPESNSAHRTIRSHPSHVNW